jgi:hypothetical protein
MQRAWTVILALATAGGALAQTTSNVSNPIADIQGVREGQFGYYVSGMEARIDKRYTHYSWLVVGVTDFLELAADTDYTGSNNWAFKVKVIDDPKGKYALSGGFNAINGNQSTPFVVGRYNFNDVRFHFGWLRDDRQRFMCGIDFPICPGLSGGIDHTSSDGGITWAGVFWEIPGVDGLSLSANFGVPNNKADGNQHSFGLIYGFRF